MPPEQSWKNDTDRQLPALLEESSEKTRQIEQRPDNLTQKIST